MICTIFKCGRFWILCDFFWIGGAMFCVRILTSIWHTQIRKTSKRERETEREKKLNTNFQQLVCRQVKRTFHFITILPRISYTASQNITISPAYTSKHSLSPHSRICFDEHIHTRTICVVRAYGNFWTRQTNICEHIAILNTGIVCAPF